jgi:hypothetical protein
MRPKTVFKAVMMSMIPIFAIGVGLHSKSMMIVDSFIFIACLCTAGVKGFVDPVNFDWDMPIENHLPKTPLGLKIHIVFIRVKSVVLISVGLLLLYFILIGELP